VGGGLRPVVADRSEGEQALREIETLTARVRALVGEEGLPEMPEGRSLRVLWAHLDRLREMLRGSIDDLRQGLERKVGRLRNLIGTVRAEAIPSDWVKSDVSTHLLGIAKLLGRSKEALNRGLEREVGRIDDELAGAGEEDWALAWKKRSASFERIWGDLEHR